MSIAWVFPGQGSQKIGMADSLVNLPGAKQRFDLASDLLGRDLLRICSESNTNESIGLADLNDTRNTQPAMFVVESIIVDDLFRQGRKPALLAGHSLGEITALYAGKVFTAEQALKLLHIRSELMACAGGGAMTAILGFDRNELDDLVNSIEGVVIANDNSSSQVVLSGLPKAVEKVSKELNCKRAIPLNVSGAFHSPYMEEAAKSFSKELNKVQFKNSEIPLLSNSEPIPTIEGEVLKERLKKQMIKGVRWRESMDVMVREKIETIVEIGPGNVLSGLAKRSLKGVITSQLSTAKDLGY